MPYNPFKDNGYLNKLTGGDPADIVDPLDIRKGMPGIYDHVGIKEPDDGTEDAKIAANKIKGVRHKKSDAYSNTVQSVYDNTQRSNREQTDKDNTLYDSVRIRNNKYLDKSQRISGDFVDRREALRHDLATNQKSTNEIYDQNVIPELKNLQEERHKDIGAGLTLEELNDPNNRVASAYRDQYDDLADETGRIGLQQSGILGSMGAQQTAQQFSNAGMPLSVGQMQAMGAMNNQQAGMAYARTQDQMARLREQGLNVGRDMALNSYGGRQNAIQGAQSLAGQMESAGLNRGQFNQSITNNMAQFDGDIANSLQGHADRVHGIGVGQDGLFHSLQSARIGRNLANKNFLASGMGTAEQMKYDADISALGGKSAIDLAQAQGDLNNHRENVRAGVQAVVTGAPRVASMIAGNPAPAMAGPQGAGGQPITQNINPSMYGTTYVPQNQYINPARYAMG